MGKNKLAKFAEMKLLPNVIQPTFGELHNEGFFLKGKWKENYFGNGFPVIVELGCGKGEYAVELAERNPDRNFIGIDIKGARMHTGAKCAIDHGLKNVGFIRTKIENCALLFGPDEVDEIWLTFPDPQMKKVRKRMTSTHFLHHYRKFLPDGGIINLKTDSAFLYAYSLALATFNRFDILAATDNLYESDLLNDILSIQTFYEKQWRDRGITIKFLSFRLRREGDLLEPEGEFEKDPYRSFGRSAKV